MPVPYDPRSLLKKRQLTGEEVGRALLLDTALGFREYIRTGQMSGIFTQAELEEMLLRLKSSQEAETYNHYVALLNFLQKSQAVALSYRQEAESAHYLLMLSFGQVQTAELFSLYQRKARSLPGGTEMDEASAESATLQKGGLDGLFSEPAMREASLSDREQLRESLCRCVAYNRLYDLIAQRVNVPEITAFQADLSKLQTSLVYFDHVVDALALRILQGEEGIAKEKQLRALFPPLDADSFSPSLAAERKVRAQLSDLSIFHNINIHLAEQLAQSAIEGGSRAHA